MANEAGSPVRFLSKLPPLCALIGGVISQLGQGGQLGQLEQGS